ncbi:MAG: Carboxyl-terminal protease [Candidatus Magasanikbacteria bacterium GW2011_GWA2_45_39]|uniref:Carboxyl-terminal protease n=2 Tax=Candidatus Magasanikiibacteriota TaxID=1752731 RepID=A0A0G1QHX5_9BACT|nr:MAG: Carboxyl-terminal protease [Candidatus Magasanikbacteria bacterium GW2011_GWA2_45_39]
MRHMRRYKKLIISGLLLVAGFSGGMLFGRLFAESTFAGGGGLVIDKDTNKNESVEKSKLIFNIFNKDAAPEVKDVDFKLFWDVWNKVQQKSLQKPVADSNLFYGSLEGLVASLKDPYSVFLRPQLATRFSQDLSGSFSGIGAEIGIKDDVVTVIAPLPDSPAEQAGVKSGDKIIEIDGADTSGFSIDEAVNRIRGVKGTIVKLNLWRKGVDKPFKVDITRDTIVIKSVTWKMKDNNIAYLKIAHFNQDTSELFDQAVRQIVLKNPRGLVLDLRNDPGGFLDTAVRVASEWIEKGDIVKEHFSDGREETYQSNGSHRLVDISTVVLVNQGSASASEIVAGALQDYGKGKLIGQKTFGKGSVQDYEQFTDGSALKLTIAEWLTPKGRHINKVGVAPDEVIEDAPADQKASPTGAPSSNQESVDVVLERALKILNQ